MRPLFFALCLLASASADSDNGHWHKLSFLSGCWAGDVGGSQLMETWGNASGFSMLGTSKTIKGDQTAAFEFLRIIYTPDGTIRYIPYIGGTEASTFLLVEASDNHSLFTNPDNDFPQAIRYQRSGKELTINLSGEQQSFGYTLTRQNCP